VYGVGGPPPIEIIESNGTALPAAFTLNAHVLVPVQLKRIAPDDGVEAGKVTGFSVVQFCASILAVGALPGKFCVKSGIAAKAIVRLSRPATKMM